VKLDRLNAPLLLRLLQLDRHAERLAELAEQAEGELALSRAYLNGKRQDPAVNVDAVRDGFDAVLAKAKRLRAAANAEQKVLSGAKLWLELLPPDAELEAADAVVGDGLQLDEVRRRKAAVADEIKALRAVPVPSADIRERLQSYVEQLAHAGRPDMRGIEGGALQVYWPDAGASRSSLSGFNTDSANALLMAACLFPDVLVDRLMATVEASTSKPMPPPARLARLRELAGELDQLGRVEVALVDAAIVRACPWPCSAGQTTAAISRASNPRDIALCSKLTVRPAGFSFPRRPLLG
jgi:hypothetical protein